MTIERIEYHPPVTRSPKFRIAKSLLEGGGMELLEERGKTQLEVPERTAIEDRGFDLVSVQRLVDSFDHSGIRGERTAALLRGAFNDLIDRINELERESIPTKA